MNNTIINIDILNFGQIKVELYKDIAPKTVDNFVSLINENYFENSSFHRVIKGFMIQGGIGSKLANPIYGEFKSNGFNNTLKHERGVISMARTMVPNSASSQFFIMHMDSPHLDGEYAAFGKVISGIEIVDLVSNAKTDFNDQPLEKIVISNITIEK